MSPFSIGRFSRPGTARVAIGGAALCLALLAGCDGGGPPDTSMVVAPTQPVALDTPPPAYPPELACFDKGGTVGLLLEISVEGTPVNIRVENGSGHPQLDQAALDAVKTWRFRPATRNGTPVQTDLRVPVTFTPPTLRPDMCFQYEEQQ
jgi:protein TonB